MRQKVKTENTNKEPKRCGNTTEMLSGDNSRTEELKLLKQIAKDIRQLLELLTERENIRRGL